MHAGKKLVRVAVLLLSLVFFTVLPAGAVYATNAQLQEAKKKAAALEEEKKKVQSTIKELETVKSDTAAYVKKLDDNLSALDEEIEALGVKVSDKEKEIEEANIALEEAKVTQQEQYEDMKLRIKYMYENGQTSLLEMIADSGSITELLSRAEYASQIGAYDRRKLNEYIAAKEAVEQWELTLEQEHDELTTLLAETEAKEESVKQLLAVKEAELASVSKQLSSAQSELSQYEADIKAQEDQMKAIEAEIKKQEEEARKKAEAAKKSYSVTNLGSISFTWPCPASSNITSGFGARTSPTKGASSNHQGIDISAPKGSNIVAAAAGTVVISTYSYSAGNYIMIDHGGGVSTVYMHCSSLLVSKGATVSKGQVIAKVGSTGYSTGNHLHFGIRSGGTYVNPTKYVSP